MNLYLTADQVGTETGGGAVTFHESEALKELGPCEVWDRKGIELLPSWEEPWKWDGGASLKLARMDKPGEIKLCHGYAGTFSRTIRTLKEIGVKVCWTVAAHDLEESIKEHETIFGSYPFKHMSDPVQFARYRQGYLDADVVVCPSQYSADIMRRYGRTGRIEVIPHGCHLPEKVLPLPERFTVGYLGAFGPDKGVMYLLQAWKKLAYKDATLILAGKDSARPDVQDWCRTHGGGNIWFAGWMNDVSDFYNAISVYVQPSVSEAFGIEVLEAYARDRQVICSDGAGASEMVALNDDAFIFQCRNVDQLSEKIRWARAVLEEGCAVGCASPTRIASDHTWDKIRERYKELWKEMLA